MDDQVELRVTLRGWVNKMCEVLASDISRIDAKLEVDDLARHYLAVRPYLLKVSPVDIFYDSSVELAQVVSAIYLCRQLKADATDEETKLRYSQRLADLFDKHNHIQQRFIEYRNSGYRYETWRDEQLTGRR